jgi:hypothetical protein
VRLYEVTFQATEGRTKILYAAESFRSLVDHLKNELVVSVELRNDYVAIVPVREES